MTDTIDRLVRMLDEEHAGRRRISEATSETIARLKRENETLDRKAVRLQQANIDLDQKDRKWSEWAATVIELVPKKAREKIPERPDVDDIPF